MTRFRYFSSLLMGGACAAIMGTAAYADDFNIPGGDLKSALDIYTAQTGVALIYPAGEIAGVHTHGVNGDVAADVALSHILADTGFAMRRHPSGAIAIMRDTTPSDDRPSSEIGQAVPTRVAAAAAGIESVIVTSSKIKGDIQTVPIAITALSQEQLTSRQIAGGPDLVKEVPNLTFSKTNFSGYTIQIRGIGTQAISATTDPAVAVALNDIPFIRNHFFEQEFFDVNQVEVLRGPQGTLYGRNATAGVVNVITAKPTDQFEAMASADIGNYHNRRYEGMINIPIVDDKLDIRFAGEWTKRDGYTEDTTLNTPVDGRDLWSSRISIGWKPASDLQTYFIWEHFSEDDDRLRSGKQLCETANPPTALSGQSAGYSYDVSVPSGSSAIGGSNLGTLNADQLSQGCQATSLYAPTAFEVPNGYSLPYVVALGSVGAANPSIDPYAETTQSSNLRQIQSTLLPTYRAKNDTLEFNATYNVSSALALTSQTGYNQDSLWSTEDYNRFDTSPGIFIAPGPASIYPNYYPNYFRPDPTAGTNGIPADSEVFCDPQLGCSNRIVAEDLDEEHAWQFSQEFRLASNFSGPFNFGVGGNYLHYETEENYYVFINALSIYALSNDHGGNNSTLDNSDCLQASHFTGGWQNPDPALGGGEPTQSCIYLDTNPIGSLNTKGHNYFLSQNPYVLNSYAGFGETYYNITPNLKLTMGLRWTIDQKHFTDIASELASQGYGYPVSGVTNQGWDRMTGRSVLDWSPQLNFTDQSLFYLSYSHGYKAGGANPPGAIFASNFSSNEPFVVHPLTFKPEYIEAFEFGTKNTLLDGSLTLNGDIFYYDYTGYQISEIVDRTAINNNYNAHVEGAEVTANWEPVPGLKFNFAGGWEDTAATGGDAGIDLMDRTAGMSGWMVVKPFPTDSSNCILPTYVVAALLEEQQSTSPNGPHPNDTGGSFACGTAYSAHLDPGTGLPHGAANPTGMTVPESGGGQSEYQSVPIPAGYPGFNPLNPAINNGEGFAKNLVGHALPNAPPFTVSLGGEYSMPVSDDWVVTLHSDFYWQADSWARIFNDNPYDRIDGYTNVNVALILTSANGWQVMGYVKNVFNVTAITGDFLNSDDSGLTTNVFLTDPRLFGVRVTKNF